MSISFIFAMDTQQAIGLNNQMPWRLPADQAYFRRTTMEHTVVMGRKTYESMGNKPLTGRNNVILTRNPEFTAEGCIVLHTVEEVIARYGTEETFVIGGAEIYQLFMPLVDRMYITLIEHEFAADTFFPEFEIEDWEIVASEEGIMNDKNPYEHSFLVYDRVDKSIQ